MFVPKAKRKFPHYRKGMKAFLMDMQTPGIFFVTYPLKRE